MLTYNIPHLNGTAANWNTPNPVVTTYKIQHRNDTTANWNTHNPVLLKGEIGIEFQSSTTVAWKIGDGVTAWKNLPYSSGPAGPAGTPGTNGANGMQPPRGNSIEYDGSRNYTVPSDGWIHARGTSTGSSLIIALSNNTTDLQAHSAVYESGVVASVTMPVRAGDVIGPTLSKGTFSNAVCRFYPAN